MKAIRLHNDFHNTTAMVQPDSAGYVSRQAAEVAVKKLCGYGGCQCIGIGGKHIQPNGTVAMIQLAFIGGIPDGSFFVHDK